MNHALIKKAVRHLKKDKRFAPLTIKYPTPEFDRGQKGLKPFQALTRAIIFQQLSGKAARTIFNRFLALYPKKKFPAPEDVLKTSPAKLRSAGISAQKAGYLKDLARKCTDGTINARLFPKMSDEEIREHVVAVKGVGGWTADMFLMFTVRRPDVLPVGDLGIRKGFQRLFKLRALPDAKKMEKLAEPWRPFRTVACWYLWRLADEGNNNRPD